MHSLKGPPSSPNTFQLRVGNRCDHRENGPAIPCPPSRDTQFCQKLILESLQMKHSEDINEASGNSRLLWKAVNKLLHPPSSSQPINGSKQFCVEIGNFFRDKINRIRATIASRTAPSMINTNDPKHNGTIFDTVPIVAPAEVTTIISKMTLKYSPVDVIPASLIKLFPEMFGVIIARLANLSFKQGKFPTAYKKAQITPLLKKSNLDPKDPSNLRPISNLSTVSKVLEKLFLARIKPIISASTNFCKLQSAYQERHSTETTLLKIMNDIYKNVDNKLGSVLVTLDISAAFDCVVHDILLRRLEHSFGVTGQALKWIESYLSNRTQFVKLQQEVSDTHNLDTGVPQGSCLGPFLFCVYVSTLANVVPEGVSFHQYADDVQLYCGIRTSDFIGDIKILEDCTVAIEQWFLSNGMLLNANKSDSVVVSTSAQANKIPANAVITVAGHAIKPAISLRSLGVIIDDRLSFKQHVSEVSRSCYYHIRAFRHIRHCLSYETSCAVSRCIVLSRLDYCNSLLHGTSKDNIYKLQKIQNSLVRIIYKPSIEVVYSTITDNLALAAGA